MIGMHVCNQLWCRTLVGQFHSLPAHESSVMRNRHNPSLEAPSCRLEDFTVLSAEAFSGIERNEPY